MEFPDIYNSDFKKDNFKLAKQAIDFAISNYNSASNLRKTLKKIYDSYNGIIDPKSHESLTKPYGKQSKTKYIHYNFGLNKIKTLVGEFLSTDIDPRVECVNKENVNKKYKEFLNRKAMLEMKPQIDEARNEGYDIFPGVAEEMQDETSFLSPENFKTENEKLLTRYLKDKMKSEKMKIKFRQNLVDQVNSCIVFGKVDTVNGKDTYRRISPLNALFLDTDEEGFMDDSPYLGEKRLMYYHQVLKEFDITKEKEKEELKELAQVGANLDLETANRTDGGKGLEIPVYTIEFKTIANISYFRIPNNEDEIIREIPEDEYNSRRSYYEKGHRRGKFTISKVYHEEVWEITRIGETLYKKIRPISNQANTEENDKLLSRYNYVMMITETIEGSRVPLQLIISKLDNAYNDTMFLINRELRKPSGNALGINMGYLPKKVPYNQIMTELTDDGTIRYNTSAEGNQGNLEGRGDNVLNGIMVSDKARTIDILIRLKNDLEQTLDRITGISRGRAGMERATTTATTSNNNLETSRTVTYDLFYYLKEYIDEVLTRMAEKGKTNFIENNPDLFGGIYSEEEFNFIRATKDIAFENFSAYINDGRKELIIRQKIEELFQTDINSQSLRTKDVAKFYLQDTLAEGLKVLDNAYAEMDKIKNQSQKQQSETELEKEQIRQKAMIDNREDEQEHDIDKIQTQGEVDKEKIRIQKSFDQKINSDKNRIQKRPEPSVNNQKAKS